MPVLATLEETGFLNFNAYIRLSATRINTKAKNL